MHCLKLLLTLLLMEWWPIRRITHTQAFWVLRKWRAKHLWCILQILLDLHCYIYWTIKVHLNSLKYFPCCLNTTVFRERVYFYCIHKVDTGILSSIPLCCIIHTNIYWNIYFSTFTMATGRRVYSNVLLLFTTWLYQFWLIFVLFCMYCRGVPSNIFYIMVFFF